MFYIDHIDKEKRLYGVADSDDGAIDLLTQEEFEKYSSLGYQILSWDDAKKYITGKMNKTCNYSLWKKLERGCYPSELVEYLEKYSVYHIAEYLNKYGLSLDLSRGCKIFDYSGSSNYFIFTVYLSDGSLLILRIDSDFEVVVERISGNWHFKKYPSGAGSLYGRLFKKYDLDVSGIKADENYLLLYSSSNLELILVGHYSLSLNSVLVKQNPNKVVIQ